MKKATHYFAKLLFVCIVFLCSDIAIHGQIIPTSEEHRFTADVSSYIENFKSAPMVNAKGKQSDRIITLPMPDGSVKNFRIARVQLMSPEFKAAFPNIHTFSVEVTDESQMSGRLTISPTGLIATIFTPDGLVEIEPIDLSDRSKHRSKSGPLVNSVFLCGFDESMGKQVRNNQKATFSNGATTRTYDLAIVTTGEFGTTHGGVAGATAVVTAQVNALEDIYEKDLAIKFNLLTPRIFTDPNTDPFNGTDRVLMAAEAVAANWPDPNSYDWGHVLHSSGGGAGWGGGVAAFGLCDDSLWGASATGRTKAGAWSSVGNSAAGAVGLFAHECGHQCYMSHTFNGIGGSCTTNISTTSAYEVGSGSTIMSYQGICQANNNIPSSGGGLDNYFHTHSLSQAITRMNATSCPATAASGNTPPVVNANPCGGAYTIPIGTPFRLRGSGTDANNDPIYYSWEQLDEDGAGTPTQGFIGAAAAASTTAPLFRSFPPTMSPERYFPSKDLLVANNYASNFEALPTVARTLNFQLTGRDMMATGTGGGVHCSSIAITVNGNGPLAVTAPNGGENLNAGAVVNVTWALNGIAFITNVNIKMSIDGGMTYPYTLASNTPAADGNENVTIPAGAPNVTTARIMVESADNTCVVPFDISDGNFTINSVCNAAASNICPTTPMTLPAGDPGLNLTFTPHYGGAVTQHTFNINAGSPTGPLANATLPNGNVCQTAWGNEKYDSFDFTVGANGNYTFQNISGGQTIFSIFEAAGYDPNNPCNSTFIGSNANGAISWGTIINAALTACTKYKIVVWTLSGANGTPTITMGGGTVLASNAAPGAGYSYTYVAVNTTNDWVAQVSASSNFQSIGAGSYKVYGASYYSGGGPTPPTVNPATWVGQTISQILSGGACAVFSANCKSLTVTGNCQTNLTVGGTIASGTYQASNQVKITGMVPSPNTVVFRGGVEVIWDPNSEVAAGATSDTVIGPCQ